MYVTTRVRLSLRLSISFSLFPPPSLPFSLTTGVSPYLRGISGRTGELVLTSRAKDYDGGAVPRRAARNSTSARDARLLRHRVSHLERRGSRVARGTRGARRGAATDRAPIESDGIPWQS